MNRENHQNQQPPTDQERDLFDRLRTTQTVAASNHSIKNLDTAPITARENPRLSAQSEETEKNTSTETENETQGLPHPARRALVSLLRQGVILAAKKPQLFELICRYQSPIRRHLGDIYLKLVLDEKAGVAFTAGIPEEDFEEEEPVSLITRRTLSLYDTLLLLVLRKYYQERELAGEQRIIIDTARVESFMTPFLPLTNSSRAERRKLNGALKKMAEKKILSAVRGDEDRYEITPIIRYIVSAEFLERLLDEYNHLAAENSAGGSE